jgi:hypothetical protein
VPLDPRQPGHHRDVLAVLVLDGRVVARAAVEGGTGCQAPA